ncbi:hypothetical protein [Acinetobacter bouvetii]|uniref:Uncharacterized protein n=1 Tax=Acinetobacter bouvetii TaxID=202951 RepID=A0A811GBY9_9GAMM|nr:hypothetical protein [Acinetobacter bouvetii]CAB1219025.1 hypothetical protein SFB21_2346 [Acinetobacter bouvetii]
MKFWLIKAVLLIFSVGVVLCLGFGFYHQDLLITAVGILLIFCIILLALEYKKMDSNPFD